MKKQILGMLGGVVLATSLSAGAQVVVRVGPPPPPLRERVGPPRPGYEWRAGYHRWDGARYVWVPGDYIATPHPGAHWVPGHWANRGGGYVWIEGHWR